MNEINSPRMIFFEDFENIFGISAYLHRISGYVTHGHNFYEFECVISGSCTVTINGKCHTAEKGDIIFVTPADVHSYNSNDGEKIRMLTVHIDSTALISNGRLTAGVIKGAPHLFDTLRNLYEEYRDNSPWRKALLKNLIDRVILLYMKHKTPLETQDIPTDVTGAVYYINKHFSEPLTLAGVSAHCGYNPSYFSRKFKQYTNYSFVSYLNHVRLVYAINLLNTDTDKSVGEISAECGFNSIRHFNREFRREFEITPSEYRRKEN